MGLDQNTGEIRVAILISSTIVVEMKMVFIYLFYNSCRNMNQNLGNLEETILLIVAVMQEEAYGYTVSEEYVKNMGNRISISAVHTVLKRLEKKGLIQSEMGGATAERGGRRKRIFKVTKTGMNTLEFIQNNRMKLWNMMPKLNFSY